MNYLGKNIIFDIGAKYSKYWRQNIQNIGGKIFKILEAKYSKYWRQNIQNIGGKIFHYFITPRQTEFAVSSQTYLYPL
jgi:hypothetical protein